MFALSTYFFVYRPWREIHVTNHSVIGVKRDFHESLNPALGCRGPGEIDREPVVPSCVRRQSEITIG